MWGSVFPVIVFTDNRSVTRFFQTKIIPPPLWNACDYVLQYNFVIAHVAGAMNTAADFLSRAEVNPTEKLEMNIRNDVTTKAIEVNIQSTGVAEEESLYILPEEVPSEQQLWDEKESLRKTAKEETHNEPENEISELQNFHKPTAGTIDYREGHSKDNAKTRLEQNNDPVLRNLRAKIQGEPYDETALTQDYRYKHYLQNIPRIEIRQDILTRRYYNDTGMIQKYYYPCIAKHIRSWVTKCQMCIQNKRISNDLLKTELLNCPECDLGPEDILQMDILPNLPPSGGYDKIITAMDVFSRYLFAYPVTRITAPAVAKVIMDILCKHTYLPTTIITDMGTQFNSQVTKEVAAVLSIELKHATTKHAQTIALLERTHASVKAHLKAATGEFRNNWHKFLPLAVLNHNTTYLATLGCEPTRVFHGRIPHNILDFKLGYNPNPRFQPQTEVAEEVQRRIALHHDQTKKNIMQSYPKYKAYYDRKAKAAPLASGDYCFFLNPKADTQATKIPFREFRWVGPYKVENVLSNNNYIVRRLGTNKTQLLHRIRLRIYIPQAPLADNFVRETDWQKEDTVIAQDDLYTHTWDTNFGSSPFDSEHETNDQQEDIVEYQPEIYRPPSPEISQNKGGTPAVQPAVTDEEPQIITKEPTENENHEPIPETLRNPEISQDTPVQNSPKTPENNPGIDAQNTEKTVNTRGEKYNLRPNPNHNYSDSYRY